MLSIIYSDRLHGWVVVDDRYRPYFPFTFDTEWDALAALESEGHPQAGGLRRVLSY